MTVHFTINCARMLHRITMSVKHNKHNFGACFAGSQLSPDQGTSLYV